MRRVAMAMALGLGAASPLAKSTDLSGYVRAGPLASHGHANHDCYGLSGPGLKYRLGNECDVYAELMLTQAVGLGGANWDANVMAYLFTPGLDRLHEPVKVNQRFVEMALAPGESPPTAWLGQRRYGRADVHIVDTYYTDLSGTGVGVDGLSAGPGRVGLAYFRNNEGLPPGSRLNVDWRVTPLGEVDMLRATVTFTRMDDGAARGAGLSLQQVHELDAWGANTLWLQWACGSVGLNGNFGDAGATCDGLSARMVDSLTWQRGRLGGQTHLLWQRDQTHGSMTQSLSAGMRMSFAWCRHWKHLTELGLSRKGGVGSMSTQRLAKLTLSEAFSTGPGFWDRPEWRVYSTFAWWNAAAAQAGAAGEMAATGSGLRHGTTVGTQVEWWF